MVGYHSSIAENKIHPELKEAKSVKHRNAHSLPYYTHKHFAFNVMLFPQILMYVTHDTIIGQIRIDFVFIFILSTFA